MHVHDLNPWRTLIVMVAFAFLILLGLLTMKKPMLKYEMDLNSSLTMLQDTDSYFHPGQLEMNLNNNEENLLLIDLRSSFDYSQGAIPGAANMSTYELTQKENIKRLKNLEEKGVTVVFYDEDQLKANGPWMLFRQLGFKNIKILLGGYNHFVKWKNGDIDSNNDNSYLKGIAKYDFSLVQVGEQNVVTDNNVNKPAINITRRKKTAVASGGC